MGLGVAHRSPLDPILTTTSYGRGSALIVLLTRFLSSPYLQPAQRILERLEALVRSSAHILYKDSASYDGRWNEAGAEYEKAIDLFEQKGWALYDLSRDDSR
jgi:hypothetical protein